VTGLVVTFLGLVSVMLVRSREVALWQVLAIGLFGFYLSWTPFAEPIETAVQWLVSGLTHTS